MAAGAPGVDPTSQFTIAFLLPGGSRGRGNGAQINLSWEACDFTQIAAK